MNKTILIAGISGVGKSTFCKSISLKNLDVSHIVASSINLNFENLDFETKQMKLAFSLRKIVQEANGNIVLIDGHLLVKNQKVPIEAIKILQLSQIVYLIDTPEAIKLRRENDKFRDRNRDTVDKIKSDLNEELSYCRFVASELGIPLRVVELSKLDLNSLLKELLISSK